MTEDITDPEELRRYGERLEQNIQAVERRLKRLEDEYGLDREAVARQNVEAAGDVEMLKRLRAQLAELKKQLE